MADVLTILQQFLCYGSQACTQEFQQYAYKPMEGIFYAVFFPIVFILLFVYIVSGAVGSLRAKGFRILIAVAVFALIILQGWYHFFMVLGKLWLYVLIFLGFFWVLIHTFVGRREESGGAQARAAGAGGAGGGSGLGRKIMGRVVAKATGAEKATLDAIKAQLALFKTLQPGDREVGRVSYDIATALNQYWQDIQLVGGFPDPTSLHKYKKLIEEYKRLCHEKKARVPEGVSAIESGIKKY